MNKKTRLIKMMSVLFSLVIFLSACGQNSVETTEETTTQNETETTTEETKDMVKVSFLDSDGTTVLEEKEVEKGSMVEMPEITKEGHEFLGWHVTPQLNRPFDFNTAINEDTSVYGAFTKYVEDTRDFYILGNGTSELLSKSEYGKLINDDYKLEKQDSDTENLYTITIDLEAGDEFQFAIDEKWGQQRGFGYLDTIEKDGKEYFENAGALGDASTKKANIKVVEPGTYTFTLKTHPGEDYYDTEDEYYTEEGKDNFNYNPYDTITWSVK